MTIMSSRPEDVGLPLDGLTIPELQLITAFLYVTRFKSGVSLHQDAAFSLLTKIEELMGDKFVADAAVDVDMKVDILDPHGNIERSIGYNWIEIDV
jgi:hypothetical protein